MKYLVSYLKEYARRYEDCNRFEVKSVIEKAGLQTPIIVNEHILFSQAAERIECLESRLKELEKIDKVLKILESEGV